MGIVDLRLTMLAIDVVIHGPRLQRPRPEQGDQRNNVVDLIWQQAPDQISHPPGFKLKYTDSFSTPEQLECRRIVERDVMNIDRLYIRAGRAIHCPDGPVDDG